MAVRKYRDCLIHLSCTNTYVYFNMNFHATFLKINYFLKKHYYIIMFQCYQGSFSKYICNAYIAVCTCINILLYIQCNMSVPQFFITSLLCANLFGITFMIHATNISGMLFFHSVATKHIYVFIRIIFKLHFIKTFFTST